VRGICCLRPGIPGLSDRIQVRAIVDRFLEHDRVFRFANGGTEEVYISSADWMPRNFHRRVEILIPILDAAIRDRIVANIDMLWSDNVKTWELARDGSYGKSAAVPGALPQRAQHRFIELARERAKQSDPLAFRSGRFHILRVPQGVDEQVRRVKSGKKKKSLQ